MACTAIKVWSVTPTYILLLLAFILSIGLQCSQSCARWSPLTTCSYSITINLLLMDPSNLQVLIYSRMFELIPFEFWVIEFVLSYKFGTIRCHTSIFLIRSIQRETTFWLAMLKSQKQNFLSIRESRIIPSSSHIICILSCGSLGLPDGGIGNQSSTTGCPQQTYTSVEVLHLAHSLQFSQQCICFPLSFTCSLVDYLWESTPFHVSKLGKLSIFHRWQN